MHLAHIECPLTVAECCIIEHFPQFAFLRQGEVKAVGRHSAPLGGKRFDVFLRGDDAEPAACTSNELPEDISGEVGLETENIVEAGRRALHPQCRMPEHLIDRRPGRHHKQRCHHEVITDIIRELALRTHTPHQRYEERAQQTETQTHVNVQKLSHHQLCRCVRGASRQRGYP